MAKTTTTTKPTTEAEAEATTSQPRNVVEAIVAVMRDVTHLGKDGFNSNGGFNFRGIDGTVNALGPAMRRHGLVMMPAEVLSYDRGEVTVGRNRTSMGHVAAKMRYRFVHSNAEGTMSELTVEAPGESMDSGDKATAKAMSVALRTALLQTFMLPTHEPDPDEQSYERSGPPEPQQQHGGPPSPETVITSIDNAGATARKTGSHDPFDTVAAWAARNGVLNAVLDTPMGTMSVEAYINGWRSAVPVAAPQEAAPDQPAATETPAEAQADPAMEQALWLDELTGMCDSVLGDDPFTVLGVKDGSLQDVPVEQVKAKVLELRPSVIAAMRENGQSAEAEVYERRTADGAPGRWDNLIAVPPMVASK